MLEFESQEIFSNFLRNGYSLHITGGVHHDVVAAVSFIRTPDGLFINAIAVSNGSGPSVCKLSSQSFGCSSPVHLPWLESVVDGSFQGSGLGRLLLSLVSHCASWCIPTPQSSIFLKANRSCVEFYLKCGFEPVPMNTQLPAALTLLVPATHRDTSPPETLLLSIPVLRLRGGAPVSPTRTKKKAVKTPGPHTQPTTPTSRTDDASVSQHLAEAARRAAQEEAARVIALRVEEQRLVVLAEKQRLEQLRRGAPKRRIGKYLRPMVLFGKLTLSEGRRLHHLQPFRRVIVSIILTFSAITTRCSLTLY